MAQFLKLLFMIYNNNQTTTFLRHNRITRDKNTFYNIRVQRQNEIDRLPQVKPLWTHFYAY